MGAAMGTMALQALMKGVQKGSESQAAFMDLAPQGVGQVGDVNAQGIDPTNAGSQQSNIFGGTQGGGGDLLGAATGTAGGSGLTLGGLEAGQGGPFNSPQQGGGLFNDLATGLKAGVTGDETQGLAQGLGAQAGQSALTPQPLQLPQAPDMGQGVQMQNLGTNMAMPSSAQSPNGIDPRMLQAMMSFFQ